MTPARLTACCATVLLPLIAVGGSDGRGLPHPLEPPDLSSPRATLSNFVAFVNEAYAFARIEKKSHRSAARRAEMTATALRFMDLRGVAPSLRTNAGREAVGCLKEVFDRIDMPAWSAIPDAEALAASPGAPVRWTVPHTEITLTRIAEGSREGQYVFSAETVERAPEFYRRARHLPYKAGATTNLVESYISAPGWMIPFRLIGRLPACMRARHGGQAIWQWGALVVTLLLTAPLMVLLYRIGGRWARRGRGLRYYLALTFPALAMVVPALARTFIADQIVVTGTVFVVIEFALNLLSLGALVVVIVGVANRLASAIGALPWFHPHGVDAQLTRLVVRVCGVIAAVATVLEGGRYLGVPVATLIAGASVSGLAVALAAQDSLKNLFGSLMILLDQPFREGDRVRAKGYEGVVKDVGLRSTKLRLDNGHLVTISNDEMARLDTENISRRPYLRRNETIRLRSDTPPEKVQKAAEIVRRLLQNHEGMDDDLLPQVRIGANDSIALAVTMTYWYHPPKAAPFAAFNERINQELLRQFQAEGINLA